MTTFGEQIRTLRLSKGMQQKELAAELGLEVTYLSKIETGRVHPPSETMIRALANILSVDEEPLLLAASKVPTEIKEMLRQSPKAPELLRTARRLGDEEWDQLIAMATRLARGNRE